MQNIIGWFGRSNLLMAGDYGIQSSVLARARVSPAFAAVFGMLQALPKRKVVSYGLVGYGLVVYAALVAVSTFYACFHYAAGAVTGPGIALAVRMWARSAIMPFRTRYTG